MRHHVLVFAPLTLGVSLLAGGYTSQPARFYLLSALPNTEAASMGASGVQGPIIGIGPVPCRTIRIGRKLSPVPAPMSCNWLNSIAGRERSMRTLHVSSPTI